MYCFSNGVVKFYVSNRASEEIGGNALNQILSVRYKHKIKVYIKLKCQHGFVFSVYA